MNRLNIDGHDESQYTRKILNPKTGKMEMPPIVNPFRAAKGDIIINSDDKTEAPQWMPRRLRLLLGNDAKPLLDDDAVHTCKRVERATLSALASLGISNIRCFIAGASHDISKLPIRDPFKELLTRLLPYQSTALLWVICDERNAGNIALARKMLSTIRNAIDLAKNILDEIAQSANITTVASPEVSLKTACQYQTERGFLCFQYENK